MGYWRRGLQVVEVPHRLRPQLVFWMLRYHAWGDHRLCPWLSALGRLEPQELGCLGPEPWKHPPPLEPVKLY